MSARFPLSVKRNPLWWFQNADDPAVPDWFWTAGPAWTRPHWLRQFYWMYVRNPLHNGTHYGIGVSDQPFEYDGPQPRSNFNEPNGWHVHRLRCAGRAYPFVSYQGALVQAYIGWREDGGWGGPTLRARVRTWPARIVCSFPWVALASMLAWRLLA